MSEPPSLVWVTDRRGMTADLPGRAAVLAQAGLDAIQVRENDLSDGALLELARAIARAIGGSGCRLLINDRVDLALAAGADGVHLKSDGLSAVEARAIAADQLGSAAEDFLVGRACHRGDEIAAVAVEGAADYVTMSPLHASGTKTPLGLEGLASELSLARRAAQGRPLPAWLALGGVTEVDLPQLASLAERGEHWGLAAVRLFQEPSTHQAAAILARTVVAELRSHS